MKPLLLLAFASVIPLGAGACAQKAKAPRAALDCPAAQGDLTRTAAAPDRRSCTYVSAEGVQVSLQLVPVQGGPYATLDSLEKTLLAEAATQRKDLAADAKPQSRTAEEAAKVAEQAASDAAGVEVTAKADSGDGVDVQMENGRVVVREGTGAETRVNLPGIHIVADDATDSADVKIGPLHVDASGDEAVIRVRRDVRLKGEALSRQKRGIRATFITEGKALPGAHHFVGYEAGGPKTGPLAVAVVRAKQSMDDGDNVYRDVKKLVRRNGGV